MPAKGVRFGKCGLLTVEEVKKLRTEGKAWSVIRDFCQVANASFYKFLDRYNLHDGKYNLCKDKVSKNVLHPKLNSKNREPILGNRRPSGKCRRWSM